MYRKGKDVIKTLPFVCGVDLKDRPVYRPFSYYVLGGIDVDGDALLLNATPGSDSDEEIDAGCAVDAACDPRVSGFDIAEQSGVDAYKKVQELAKRSQQPSDPTPPDSD